MTDFTMPSLGADMDEGTLVEWLVKPGDQVKSGDVVAVIETSKGAIETEIFENGTVAELRAQVGETLPVGSVLATIVSEQSSTEVTADSGGRATVSSGAGVKADSGPSASAGRSPATGARSEPGEPAPAAAPAVVRASPAARKRAAELGLVLADIPGTGPGTAVTLSDVETAGETKPLPTPGSGAKRGFDPESMRRGIAAAMARSKKEIPHYYLSTQIDMTRAQQWLSAENAGRRVTDRLLQVVLPLKAMALALRKVPELNGFYRGGVFEQAERVHVGMAIALRGGGLIAPALHDVDRRTLDDVMQGLNDLITRARTGMLRSSEMSDPTITLSNMGETGVEGIFGVIYPPQVAIVGLGTVVERPWVVEGRVEVRPVMQATLSADHRVSDGHRGAIFLKTLEKLLQAPEAL
ncbi:acetyltransferase component of pyruvate dehydrogenase complex [Marinobacterium nitratireducens]|uniref:Dihydrolipoamide acetyltransferase component of pyruvate dehydrogenase complex n=1 Tax=Marinobacterium nitratireducens TaxID=518897 RepID=A0A917ZMQ4_9GAMM|nr:dihydrolipoamide acetyltransferase family protein [Marinobacterium nitratireducens]GGO85783.1 acetyltransferase component of pyruvate dehydrogenase complex [Marinobacterium nitratireducens]